MGLVDLTGLNVAGSASVTALAGHGYFLQNLAEGFGFVLNPVRSSASSSDTFMAAARGKTEDGFEIVGADIVAGGFRHSNSPLQI